MPSADDVALPRPPLAVERARPSEPQPRLPYCSRFALYVFRWRSRRQLLELSDGELKDLGLTRADALGEASKPFWLG
ncbi:MULTISPECIES: DUF1127 domain-containing protein [unclassified Pseudomonas]|uniref:DUF1127 domain-containing protein n=1 Tax=unclassified Pseudomonas TaxID=196821 RepID=UPI000BC430BC|nr:MULTISPECIES: DUF1127 domain-containing protein [unclassified Pseudomonas]PVZ15336.1 uncharacterized protein YjiS (DUF1127 family) [Pseudomonas sp. URIL14HWK12:I12]PVZ24710.1 uncharacterized protein YjiS (DUF1127 family) [Pseudomonas sp. URIL14HWK12:I10]PVZ34555.1 uncharacterized protein YjiS (DUF1127 family) [Pseudomonas sp. URIL14HWK12:I11]SNZ08640.1 Uncharacterized conserved protein YjiS, DUF1127 family [Pseudomonas sp. URIL14HWK12:I9]